MSKKEGMTRTRTGKRKPDNMKNSKNIKSTQILAIALVFIVAALLIYVVFNSARPKNPNVTGDFVSVSFYFINTATNKWETESHNIPKGEQTEMLTTALREWLAGPKTEGLSKSIPSYVSIDGVKFDDVTNTVEVTFSESYNDMTAAESAVCYGSLVWTLTSFDFINNVHFYIGEAEMLKSNGQPIGLLNRDNVVLDKSGMITEQFDLKTVKLYFADAQAMELLPEEREIRADPNQPLEKYVVEELIKGPTMEGHYPIISPDIKLRPIKTEEGLCYVDFTADFIKKFEGGSAAERFMIYSIVNSLTELQHIKKVQILVEGDKIAEDKGFSMDLSKPIERYEDILGNR